MLLGSNHLPRDEKYYCLCYDTHRLQGAGSEGKAWRLRKKWKEMWVIVRSESATKRWKQHQVHEQHLPSPTYWSIHFLNFATRANTVNIWLDEQLPDPQLTSPCNTQRPTVFWHTYGPPLSPWQPLITEPFLPAHSIWSVIWIPAKKVPRNMQMLGFDRPHDNGVGNRAEESQSNEGRREKMTKYSSQLKKPRKGSFCYLHCSFLALHSAWLTGGMFACCRMG